MKKVLSGYGSSHLMTAAPDLGADQSNSSSLPLAKGIIEFIEDDPLPSVLHLQISGEAIPGKEITARGYPINGTTTCEFAWLRHPEGGSIHYIEGASKPNYWVTENDINSYLAVEVLPINSKGRKGKVLKVYASERMKIKHEDDPLPTVQDLQISGEAIPGKEIQACGYSVNGTTICEFAWLRHSEDGSINYIEGASEPNYRVTEEDVNSYLAVEVQPFDIKGRKGEVLKVYANERTKIKHEHDPLPSVLHLQISGEAIPGKEITACGYPVNGTTTCEFAWLRHPEGGSIHYIEGASKQNYWVTENDINSYLAVEVLPSNSKGRKGKVLKVYANERMKIKHEGDPLPAVQELQISGEAIPGKEIQACGYSVNGTAICEFAWLRHSEDGSINYIEGASEPNYRVTEEDVNSYLAVEVLPFDIKGRKGEVLKVYANDRKKITHGQPTSKL